MLEKYADLLVNYSLYLKPGEKLYINSTTLAEPLIKEVYKKAIRLGCLVSVNMDFEDKQTIFDEFANDEQLQFISPFLKTAMEEYDAYLYIRAPFSLNNKVNLEKKAKRSQAMKTIQQAYFSRTADGSMKRSLCQYPTKANADLAGMSMEDYEKFIFNACCLYDDDPVKSWNTVSENQQKIVDYLNQSNTIRYLNKNSDIEFSVKDRIWINSDGKTNMPSGEVFSAPVENSVNGHILFDYPSMYMGQSVKNILLEVKDGKVVKWQAEEGKELLDKILKIDGANYFGEVAIGTNYNIQRATKNILFDEKIGGSVHMALGQSYGQAGGKNHSPIHWDMICDMRNYGQIFADNKLIYKDGIFIL